MQIDQIEDQLTQKHQMMQRRKHELIGIPMLQRTNKNRKPHLHPTLSNDISGQVSKRQEVPRGDYVVFVCP